MEQEQKTAPVAETQKRLERLLTQQFRIGDIRVRADAFHRSVQELDRAFSERSNAVKGFLSMRWYWIRRKCVHWFFLHRSVQRRKWPQRLSIPADI